MKEVKFYNLPKINKKFELKFINLFKKINNEGRYIIGNYVNKFEKEYARFCGVKYCVGVGNCFDALKMSFEAYKILGDLKNGDEVLVPSNTYVASILAVSAANLKPVFVEPDLKNYNICPEKLKKNK